MRKAFFILVLLMVLGSAALSHAATNNDYCVNPIFTSNIVKPNILFVMDFSGSMQFPAYLPNNFYAYSNKDVALCGTSNITTTTNYSKRYDMTRDYYGLFDPSKYYSVSSGRYVETACGPDLTSRMGTGPNCISGNLLNWLTATRIDVARRALTGGRFNTGGGDTFLESEGSAYVIQDYLSSCKYTITATSGTTQRELSISNLGLGTCKLNGVSGQDIFVVVPAGVPVEGVVQKFYPKAHMELMVYSSSKNRVGRMLTAKDSPLSTLVSAINNETPYGGTPTGEALWEAYDFYKQEELHSYYNNVAYILKASQKDPYYDGATPIWCRKGFVLLISDGVWDNTSGGYDPMRVARTMHVEDMRPELDGAQNITTYTVYAFGDEPEGKKSMKATAMFGGFDFSSTDTFPYPYTTWPSTDSRYINFPLTQCNDPTRWDTSCIEWDKNRQNIPYNYFEADDGNEMASKLESALLDMLRRASSGTAASVLASAEGSGANLLQAFFFPKRMFDDAEIDWTGEMQNLWYYIDPNIGNSTIREDTARNNILDIFSDDIIEYEFNVGLGKTTVRRYQTDASAQKGAEDIPSPVELDEARNLWEAGIILWARDLTASPRTIYTSLDGSTLINFSVAEASSNGTLQSYLQAADAAEAQNIVSYIHGNDIAGYRNRTVTTSYQSTTSTHVWKLGDIVSSTPRLKASFPLNSYHLYPPEGYNDRTYYQYINDVDASGNPSGIYKQRGIAFVGANDGMFHAFELGKLSFNNLTSTQAARLETVDVPLGTERWAYVPKGALPYLKYLTSTDYCHTFYVNQPAVIFDASIDAGGSMSQDPAYGKVKGSWRTIVIGGMGYGGACRDTSSSCDTTSECVKTPISGVGFSSYFAFDITDPVNPKLLWEFSRSDLGFSTTGPAIVRIGDASKNGKWFAVFASGPTGPIDTTYHQFMGSSDQNLKFFVVDLLQGPGASVTVIDTGILNAFGAYLASASFDVDRGDPTAPGATPYSDDVIYMGYVKKDSSTTWRKGGVVRLVTKNDTNPANWSSRILIDDIGPVTTGITKLQDRRSRKMWIYVGTGRYYYRLDNGLTIDDPDSQQSFYGIIEPCYTSSNTFDDTCVATVTKGQLKNQTGSSSSLDPALYQGWYIDFPAPDTGYKAHRVLAQPVASYNGVVYFLTSTPSTDVCSMGGYTYLWAVWYNNGGAPPLSAISGMVVTQLSTGQIATPSLKKSDGSSALTLAGGKAMSIGQGVNIGGGFSLLGPPRPLRKILHMKEK